MRNALLVQKAYGSDFIGITGHSLGGGRAAADSAVTGVPADTFNAAGLHPNTIAPYGETIDQASGDVQNYDNPGQFLDWTHGVSIGGIKAPDAVGTQHRVTAIGPDGKPMAFRSPTTGGLTDLTITLAENLKQSVDRHLMPDVIRSLEKEREQDAATLCSALH